MMKNHSVFTNQMAKQLEDFLPSVSATTRGNLAHALIAISRDGVAPEGLGNDQLNSIVKDLYRLRFDASPQPVPIPPPATAPVKPRYYLSAESIKKMDNGPLHPSLRKTIEKAITISTQDFNVLEVRRSHARQTDLVQKGSSRTMKTKHFVQPDGFVWAADLGAWNNGKVTWGFDDYFEIVQAMDMAATQLGFASNIRWGGIWDKVLSDYGGITSKAYEQAIAEYKVRHKGPDFLDGPHFEWVA